MCNSGLPITEENVLSMTVKYETGSNFSNLANELYCPSDIINLAKQVIQKPMFDLDPASCAMANTLHQEHTSQHIYDENDDGLSKIWFGDVWLFPPLRDQDGLFNQGQWFQAAVDKYKSGEIKSCHILLLTNLDNPEILGLFNFPHCFLTERIWFATPNGKGKFVPDMAQILVYL